MKVGFVGLGKLGLPVAVSMALGGHKVLGYDIDPDNMSKQPRDYMEAGPNGKGSFNDYLVDSSIEFDTLERVVTLSDVVFFAVQTPHSPEFEGITPLTDERRDFDYDYLITAIVDAAAFTMSKNTSTIFAVISTVLPGTLDKHILSMLPHNVYLVYNPSFIAMGTTMQDYLHPEFILVGGNSSACNVVAALHSQAIVGAGIVGADINMRYTVEKMSIQSAELTKVAYNTCIGAKIAIANTLMEICHKFEHADIDDVTTALTHATKRITSGAYMHGGMGDGGGCHPRDNIAMSWLARDKNLSHDIFTDIMQCREDQARRLAMMLLSEVRGMGGGFFVFGYAYKPETNLTVGSSAILVGNYASMLNLGVEMFDPIVCPEAPRPLTDNSVVLIGCKHAVFTEYQFGDTCTVIDPFRYIPPENAGKVIHIGKGEPEPVVHDLVFQDGMTIIDG